MEGPLGTNGRTIMQVAQIISGKGQEIYSISPDSAVSDLVAELSAHRVGALLVRDAAGTLVGIVSERDVVRGLATDASLVQASVESIMTKDVVSVRPDFEVSDLTGLMTEKRIRHVPVIDDQGTLVGDRKSVV